MNEYDKFEYDPLLCVNDENNLRAAFEKQRNITVHTFGKLEVDQSFNRGDKEVIRCMVLKTCG